MMFNRIINNNEMNKFFIYLQNDKSVTSHFTIQDMNNKNEFYILYIDVSAKNMRRLLNLLQGVKITKKKRIKEYVTKCK